MEMLDSILFVDDDPVVNYYNVSIAKRLNIAREIFVQTDGQSAIDFIKERYYNNQSLPSAIFLDWYMPGTGGSDFLREINELELLGVKKIPITIVTSFSAPHELLGLASKGYQFLNKPLTNNKLQKVWQNICNGENLFQRLMGGKNAES
ncbi:MAG: response regulator [Cytophagaceae bacterium]